MTRHNHDDSTETAVPAVSRALDLIEFLAERGQPFGINELARELEIPVNSVFRILKCLEARGYVETDSPGGGYQLSTRFFSLGMRLQSRFDLRRRARPHLEMLCRQTGETTQIYFLDGDTTIVLDCVTPEMPLYLQIVPGTRMELHASAFSKAILAFMPEEEVRRLLPKRLAAMTPNTITDREQFMTELAQIRRTGMAYDREEYTLGVYCVGAPIFDVNGDIAAGAGVTGLVSRFRAQDLPRIEKQVLRCVRQISSAIGHDGQRYTTFAPASDAT